VNDSPTAVVAYTALRSADGEDVALPDFQSGWKISRHDLEFALPLPEGIGGLTIKYAEDAQTHFDLDQSGFAIVNAACDEVDFHDAGRIRESYYPVVERLLRDAFDGARVIALSHTFRRSVPLSVELFPIYATVARRVVVRPPTRRVLGGETEHAVKAMLRYKLGEKHADALLRNRVMLVTVWRPVGAVARLAVCDVRTVAYEDLAAITPDCIDDGDDHVRPALSFGSRQNWYCFPTRPGNDVLILKDYDSIDDGRSQRCFRFAIVNGAGSGNASIEVRAVVGFQQA
jgi:hypothetical protein